MPTEDARARLHDALWRVLEDELERDLHLDLNDSDDSLAFQALVNKLADATLLAQGKAPPPTEREADLQRQVDALGRACLQHIDAAQPPTEPESQSFGNAHQPPTEPTDAERKRLREAADRMSPLSRKPYTSLDLALVRDAAYQAATRRTQEAPPPTEPMTWDEMMPTELDPQPWLFISDQVFGEIRSDHDKGFHNVSGTWWAFSPRDGYEADRSRYPVRTQEGL